MFPYAVKEAKKQWVAVHDGDTVVRNSIWVAESVQCSMGPHCLL